MILDWFARILASLTILTRSLSCEVRMRMGFRNFVKMKQALENHREEYGIYPHPGVLSFAQEFALRLSCVTAFTELSQVCSRSFRLHLFCAYVSNESLCCHGFYRNIVAAFTETSKGCSRSIRHYLFCAYEMSLYVFAFFTKTS